MQQKYGKYIIIVLCIIIAIIIGILILLTSKKHDEIKVENTADISGDFKDEVVILKDMKSFLKVETNIQSFYDFIKNHEKEKALSIIDSKYAQRVLMVEKNIPQSTQFEAEEMYINDGLTQQIYYVFGYLIDENYKREAVYLRLLYDLSNNTFEIYFYEDNKEYNAAVDERNVHKTIAKNEFNKFKNNMTTTDEEVLNRYFKSYIKKALYYPEEAYNMINENYKEKKFGSLGEYKRYINSIKSDLDLIIGKIKNADEFETYDKYMEYLHSHDSKGIEKYLINHNADNTRYVFLDSCGKTYIITETAAMKYEIILDTYTIDLPEFIDKYEKASDEGKVLMNIGKFFYAIEDGDYKYAYGKLDETFKNNNFKSQAAFESYVKKNFFNQNTLSAGKAEKHGNVYLYNVTITDASKKDSKTVTKSFVMQLKEGTDFVMSFGVQ